MYRLCTNIVSATVNDCDWSHTSVALLQGTGLPVPTGWALQPPEHLRKQLNIYILIRSNKIQQYSRIYILQNYSTCFWCPSHPSSGVHKTVTAASGTGYCIRATTFRQRGTMLPAGGQQHRGCIIPQAVTHSLVFLKMGKIIARNMLS